MKKMRNRYNYLSRMKVKKKSKLSSIISYVRERIKHVLKKSILLWRKRTVELGGKVVIVEEYDREKNKVSLVKKNGEWLGWYLLDEHGNFIEKKLGNRVVYVSEINEKENKVFLITGDGEWLGWYLLDEYGNFLTRRLGNKIVYVESIDKVRNRVELKTEDGDYLGWFEEKNSEYIPKYTDNLKRIEEENKTFIGIKKAKESNSLCFENEDGIFSMKNGGVQVFYFNQINKRKRNIKLAV